MKTILCLLVVCAVALAEPMREKRLTRCRSDNDCGDDGCCLGNLLCGSYRQEGELCTLSSVFACGCQPGLTCVKTGFLTRRCHDVTPGSGDVE